MWVALEDVTGDTSKHSNKANARETNAAAESASARIVKTVTKDVRDAGMKEAKWTMRQSDGCFWTEGLRQALEHTRGEKYANGSVASWLETRLTNLQMFTDLHPITF